MWLPTKSNIVTYGTHALTPIHSMLISQWDLRPIHVVIMTTLTAVVNYIQWTSARFDIYINIKTGKYACPILAHSGYYKDDTYWC